MRPDRVCVYAIERNSDERAVTAKSEDGISERECRCALGWVTL